jgi:hypothetical protein
MANLRKKSLALLILSAIIIGFMVYPWRSPAYDAQLGGFDKSYLYVDQAGGFPRSGTIDVTPQTLTLQANEDSRPSVILASSEVSYTLDFDFHIDSATHASVPLRAVVLFPLASENASIEFNGNGSTAAYVMNSSSSRTSEEILGSYRLGAMYHMSIAIARDDHVSFSVPTIGTFVATMRDAPSLLTSDRRVVEVYSSSGPMESSRVTLANLVISVPHMQTFAPMATDPLLIGSYFAVATALLLVWSAQIAKLRSIVNRIAKRFIGAPRSLWILVTLSLLVQMALTPVANHPHDLFSEKIWIYTLMTEGLKGLYFRPLVTAVVAAQGGIPTQHAVFPYPPLLGYAYYGVALILSNLGITSIGSFAFEFLSKMVNIIAGLVGGVITYFLAIQLSCSRKAAVFASGLFLFNPAIVFDSAIWGETDTVLLVFLLAATLFLMKGRLGLMWGSIALALLTKQTALVPVGVLALISVRQRGIRANLQPIALALSTVFIAIAPYVASGYSPLIILSQTVLRVSEFAGASNMLPTSSPVAADAYSFLPLLVNVGGLTGRARMWYPDSSIVPFLQISYGLLGKILFAAAALPTLLFALTGLRKDRKEVALLLPSVLTLFSIYFPTKVSGRYFVIPIAFLIPVVVLMSNRAVRYSLWTFTATTLFSMYALLAEWSLSVPQVFPVLSLATPLNIVVSSIRETADPVLDLAILANLSGILIVTAVLFEVDLRKIGLWLRAILSG